MADFNAPSFKAADLVVERSVNLKTKPDVFPFGTHFTDHMLTINWTASEGWKAPLIKHFENISLHPACPALNYGIQLFEGMKVCRGKDNRMRLFRPMLNIQRMSKSAKRLSLPAFDEAELLECMKKLIEVDQDWVPYTDSACLYIRPVFIATDRSLGIKCPSEALLYVIMARANILMYNEERRLLADPKYTRAYKGGSGDCKLGGNYGCCMIAMKEAASHGCHEMIWLYGEDHQITETGVANYFLHWINEDGEEELATPALDGLILPGIVRQSILELTRKWGEFKVSERYLNMSQLSSAVKERRVKEMFCTGTATLIISISRVVYQGECLDVPNQDKNSLLSSRLKDELLDILFGRTPSEWSVLL